MALRTDKNIVLVSNTLKKCKKNNVPLRQTDTDLLHLFHCCFAPTTTTINVNAVTSPFFQGGYEPSVYVSPRAAKNPHYLRQNLPNSGAILNLASPQLGFNKLPPCVGVQPTTLSIQKFGSESLTCGDTATLGNCPPTRNFGGCRTTWKERPR